MTVRTSAPRLLCFNLWLPSSHEDPNRVECGKAHSLGLVPICNLFISFVGKEMHGSLCICLVVGLALRSTKNERVLCNEEIKSLLAEGTSSLKQTAILLDQMLESARVGKS